MVASTYDDALRRLLIHEGGYTNHPSDPGGPTNFGITIIDYRRYVKPDATAADIKAMHLASAKAIYKLKYWDALCCDALPAGVDYCLFDYGVNSGIARAARVLQRVVGAADDGSIAANTLAAVRARDAKTIVTAICDERLAFLKRLKTWPVFGAGWGRRVAEVRAAALAMTHQAAPAPIVASAPKPVPGKGVVPADTAARNGSAGAVVAAGGTAATQTGDATVAIITVVATIAVAAGVWWFWHWRRQRRQLASL